MTDPSLQQVNFIELPLDTDTFDEVADWLIAKARNTDGLPTIVSHINLYNYYLLKNSPVSLNKVRNHYVCLFDGIGMKLGAALSGFGWLPDLNGTDLFPLVMNRASYCQAPVFFLGATPDVLQHSIENTRKKWPNLTVCGSHTGYFTNDEAEKVSQQVHDSGAQILLVSMGSSMNVDLLLKYRSEYVAPLIWNVGGLFNFLGGVNTRAPCWVRTLRLEWVFRLLLEPGRMWKRTFVAAPWFYMHIVKRNSHSTLINLSNWIHRLRFSDDHRNK